MTRGERGARERGTGGSPAREPLTEEALRPHLPAGSIPWRVRAFGAVRSTNDVARRLAAGGAPEGTVVVAGTQWGGRGRGGTRWHSPRGGLWLSVVLRPGVAADDAHGLCAAAALALAGAVNTVAGVGASVKWPNDVLVGDRKVAGILVEGGAAAYVLGVGVNVNVPRADLPRTDAYEATSLEVETGRTLARERLLGAFLAEFEPRYRALVEGGAGALAEEWRTVSKARARSPR